MEIYPVWRGSQIDENHSCTRNVRGRSLTLIFDQLTMDVTPALMKQQVFYDPEQVRWRLLRRLLDVAGVSLMLLVIFFVYSALKGEHLPELLLPSPKHTYRALRETEKQKAKERRRLLAHRGHRKTKSAASSVELNSQEGIRAAFYVQWDASSFSSLREYARQIDLLFPEWLSVLTPDGHLQSVDPQTNQFFDVIHGATIHPCG